jgi:predicted glycosyltransferase
LRIWVDIANSPQVLLFSPIINELRKRGYELVVTTRHHGETVSLADKYGLDHTVIGAHGGSTLAGKGFAIALRGLKLFWFMRNHNVELAISGCSYSQALATYCMKTPLVGLSDYEGNPGMRIICHVAKKILVPQVFSKENLYRLGATVNQIESFNGLKENIYLSDFVPDSSFLERIGVSSGNILVTMRPASEVSAYHQFENPLFDRALEFISAHEGVHVIVLPRDKKQRQKYASLRFPNVQIPERVLNGPDLIYHSDIVVGAGGTMNREAVVLGTPVYSLFMGLLGSVDKHLIESGKMIHIRNLSDISKVKVRKKQSKLPEYQTLGRGVLDEVANKILLSIS